MSDTIKTQLAQAVGARKDSLKALRARIIDLLEDVPVGTKLSDDDGLVVKVVRVCTGASQWSNQKWGITIKGWAVVDDANWLVAESLDGWVHDGSNAFTRTTEPTCLICRGEAGDELSWLYDGSTRALAERLPAAIERYMALCEAERAANDTTLQRA